MNNGNSKPFAVDPYAHQPESEWKVERLANDQQFICEILGIEPKRAYAASANFEGRGADFFRFIVALRFLGHVLRNELTENATMLRVVSIVFTVEGLAPSNLPNRNRLKRFLSKYLIRDEKLILLAGFLFAEPHPLGQAGTPARHLMYVGALPDTAFRKKNFLDRDPEYCSTGPNPLCFCERWLREQTDDVVDDFTERLGDRLYDMRNAVTHDAMPVFFASAEKKPQDVALWSMTLVDVFTQDQRRSFVTYESGLQVRDLVEIFLAGFRRCFEDGARF